MPLLNTNSVTLATSGAASAGIAYNVNALPFPETTFGPNRQYSENAPPQLNTVNAQVIYQAPFPISSRVDVRNNNM